MSKIIFWRAFQEKKKVRFSVCHSGLDPESSDFSSYKVRQRHWIPAFAGMTIGGFLWTVVKNKFSHNLCTVLMFFALSYPTLYTDLRLLYRNLFTGILHSGFN